MTDTMSLYISNITSLTAAFSDADMTTMLHIDNMTNMVVHVAAHPLVILVECVAIDTLWKYLVRSDL